MLLCALPGGLCAGFCAMGARKAAKLTWGETGRTGTDAKNSLLRTASIIVTDLYSDNLSTMLLVSYKLDSRQHLQSRCQEGRHCRREQTSSSYFSPGFLYDGSKVAAVGFIWGDPVAGVVEL